MFDQTRGSPSPIEINSATVCNLEKTNKEYQEQLKALTRSCEATHMENAMLADYLTRISQGSTLEEMEEEYVNATKPTKSGKKSQANKPASRPPETLSIDMKFFISNSEVDSLMKDIEATKRTAQKNVELLKALMEETEIRTQELKREAYELRRDVVVAAENTRTGKTMAEPLLRWMEEKLTKKDALASKLLMKNHALKAAIRKVRQQLRAKDDNGEDLAYIDFHQMQIENQQYIARIEETTAELIDLKKTTSVTSSRLATLKKNLGEQEILSEELKQQHSEKGLKLAILTGEVFKVGKEKDSAAKEADSINQQAQNGTEMPNVRRNVELRAKELILEAQVKKYTKAIELGELSRKTLVSKLRKVRQESELMGITFDVHQQPDVHEQAAEGALTHYV